MQLNDLQEVIGYSLKNICENTASLSSRASLFEA
jgi:hypothetical protein